MGKGGNQPVNYKDGVDEISSRASKICYSCNPTLFETATSVAVKSDKKFTRLDLYTRVGLNHPHLQSILEEPTDGYKDPIYCDKIDSDTRTNAMTGQSLANLLG
ncbi:unnamed protein product [Dovyalis caffra]|uniref:Uncharacterized protein n=1 Tax=Dovyalis caffra TaxID=77055 RepID=A0AAV1REL5_9ROSI|nr:unnamed protein product [Dovyalis caffra]